MRGNVGSFTVAYATFFQGPFRHRQATITLNNRFIMRKRSSVYELETQLLRRVPSYIAANSVTHTMIAFMYSKAIFVKSIWETVNID